MICALAVLGPWACAVYEAESGDSSDSTSAYSNSGAPNAVQCDVESVYDGDTIGVICAGEREKVRLYCIDAPEMQQRPWGIQSRDHLRGLLGPRVGVERFDTDRYGRTVAKLWTNGENTAARMVGGGWAVVFPRYYPRTEGSYYRTEEASKGGRAGGGAW